MVTLQLQHSDLTPPKIAAAGELTRCKLGAASAWSFGLVHAFLNCRETMVRDGDDAPQSRIV